MNQEKQDWMQEKLSQGWVSVLLDPRRKGVRLPVHLCRESHIVLQYGFHMPIPMYDLLIDEEGIFATLSFQQVPCETFVPWSAVFAMSDGEQQLQIWRTDVPTDLDLLPGSSVSPSPVRRPSASAGKRHLTLVD